MRLLMSKGGIPVGTYLAEFISVEAFDDNADKYGPALLLKWKIIGGNFDGQEASRICSKKLNPKTALHGFAVALKGGKLEGGEAFDFDDYLGAQGSIIVEETPSGSTRVATFLKANTA